MRFAAIIVLALSCAFSFGAQQQGSYNTVQNPTAPTAHSAPSPQQDDTDAMRDDLRQMRVLVQQMEMNLAFVDATQSPLKHQFQLEIDMWRTLIDQMQRRLDAAKVH